MKQEQKEAMEARNEQIRNAGKLFIPPSVLAVILGEDPKEVARKIFTDGEEYKKLFEQGLVQFKIHYETHLMKCALGVTPDIKLDKAAVEAMMVEREANKELYAKEQRLFQNNQS